MTSTIIKNSVKCCSLILRNFIFFAIALIGAQAFAQNTGSIMVHKTAADAAADQEFTFTGTGSGFPEDFTLVKGQFRTISGLSAGTYVITETATEGWRTANIICDTSSASSTVRITSSSSSGGDDGFDPGDDRATITLGSGGFVECEIVNEEAECGDGVLDAGETCDPGIEEGEDGFVEGCRDDCTFCGDEILDDEEECEVDDANCSDVCEIEGAVKIVKRLVSHNFETIPSAGFRFLGDFDLENEFNLAANRVTLFPNLSGEVTFYEIRPFVPNPNPPGPNVESQGWFVQSIECVCLVSTAGETCASTFEENLEAREEQLLDAPADPHNVIGSVTIDVRGGETVVCTFTNEDEVCPPGEQSPPAGNSNTNTNVSNTTTTQTQSTSNTGGLAATNSTATENTKSGCSSMGGLAGLSTMLLLAMPLLAMRLRRGKSKS